MIINNIWSRCRLYVIIPYKLREYPKSLCMSWLITYRVQYLPIHLKIKSFVIIIIIVLSYIHTLRVHYAQTAANLNSGYSKYAKVARVHYFCTIALRTSRAVLTRAWASRRVDLRERWVDLFSKRVMIFCW